MSAMTRRVAVLSLTFAVVAATGLSGAQAAPHDLHDSAPPSIQDQALPFISGFRPASAVTSDLRRITGIDDQVNDNWDIMGGWIDRNGFQYLAGQPLTNFVNSEIVNMTGRLGTTTKVLRLTSIRDDPNFTSLTRNELSLYSKAPPNDYRQAYARYWVKLPAATMGRIPVAQPSPWWNFMEWKEGDSGNVSPPGDCEDQGAEPGGTNNYRVNININRNAGQSQFYWRILAEQVQPCRVQEWQYLDTAIAVPIDEWFRVEVFFKKHATDGRFYFKVNNTVVLDTAVTRPAGFTGRTQHGAAPLPLATFSVFKVYHDEDWWTGGPSVVLYDDLLIQDTIPPS